MTIACDHIPAASLTISQVWLLWSGTPSMSCSVRQPMMELDWLARLIRALYAGRDIDDADPDDGGE